MPSNLRSLKRLGVERLAAFLQAARADDSCLAVTLLSDELANGANPADLLANANHGYSLDVRRMGDRRFRIAVGCHPGPMLGDGGEWDVEFDTDGRVVSCVAVSMWIS